MVVRAFFSLPIVLLAFGCSSASGKGAAVPIGYDSWDEAVVPNGAPSSAAPATAMAAAHQPSAGIDLPAPLKPPPPPMTDDEVAASDAPDQDGAEQAAGGPVDGDTAAAGATTASTSESDDDENQDDPKLDGKPEGNTKTSVHAKP